MEGSSPARSNPSGPSQGNPTAGINDNSEKEVVAVQTKKAAAQAEEVAADDRALKALDDTEKMIDAIREGVQDVQTSFNYATNLNVYEKKIFVEFSKSVGELNKKVKEVGREISKCQSTMKTDLSMNGIDILVHCGFFALTGLVGFREELEGLEHLEFKTFLDNAHAKLREAVSTLKQSRAEIEADLDGLTYVGKERPEVVLIPSNRIKTEKVEKRAQNATLPNPPSVIQPDDTRKRRGSVTGDCPSKRQNTEASEVYDYSAIHPPSLVQGTGDDEATQIKEVFSDSIGQVKESEHDVDGIDVGDSLGEQNGIITEHNQIDMQDDFLHEDMDFDDSYKQSNLAEIIDDEATGQKPADMGTIEIFSGTEENNAATSEKLTDTPPTYFEQNDESNRGDPQNNKKADVPSTAGPPPQSIEADQQQVHDDSVSLEEQRKKLRAVDSKSADRLKMEKYATNRMTRSATNNSSGQNMQEKSDSAKEDLHDMPSAECQIPEETSASGKETQQLDSNEVHIPSWLLKKHFLSAYKEKDDDSKKNLPKKPQELLEEWDNEDKKESWSQIVPVSNDETPDAEPDYLSAQETCIKAVDTVHSLKKLPVPLEMSGKRHYPLAQYTGPNNMPPKLYLAELIGNDEIIEGEKIVKLGKESAEENIRLAKEKLNLNRNGKVLPPVNKLYNSMGLRRAIQGQLYKTSFFRDNGYIFKGGAEKGTPQPVVAVSWNHPNFKEILVRRSISLIDGCFEAVDVTAFSLDEIERLKQDNEENTISALRERAQSHSENQPFEDSEETILGKFWREKIELTEYIDDHQKLMKTCREGLDQFLSKDHVDLAFLKKFDDKLRQMQRRFQELSDLSFPVITFGSNIDVIKSEKQEEAIKQLNEYMQPNGQLMKMLDELILGINTIQIYLKGPGCRTYAHWENSGLASININLGPDDCIWFAISMKYAADVEFLLCQNGIKQDVTPVWPLEKVLEDNGIPYYKFIIVFL